MRFLHIITSLTQGGTEKTLVNFIRFGNKNNKHLIFVLKPGGFFKKELSKKIKIFSPSSTSFFDFIKFFIFMKNYCNLNYKKHDIILTWNYQSNLISIFLKSKKLIWQIRSSGDKIFLSYKRFLYCFLNGIFSFKANKIIFNSYKSMNQHEKFFFNKNLKVIQNGFFKNKIKRVFEKSNKINFLCIARNDYYKDHKNLIKSFELFNQKFKNWNLYLRGNGIENLLKQIKISKRIRDKIILIDEKENLDRYLASCHYHVLSSLGESFPNVIGETMAMGILNISTNVGDVKYLIRNKNFLVEPENSKELARSLINAKNLYINNFEKYKKESNKSKKLIELYFNYKKYYNLIIQECEKTLNLKYLFVLPTLNGGGAERVSLELMKVINKKKKEITTDLLVLGKKTKIDYKKIFKGNINYLNCRKSFLSYFLLKKFLYKNDYEIIFSNIPNTNALLCILKLFSLKNFYLIVRESNMPNQPLKYRLSTKNLVDYILRYFYVFSDLIISPSREINKYLKKILFLKNNKCFIHLPNYIDIQSYKKASKIDLKINLPKNYLLSLSNIQFQKNLELLILCFKNFIKKHPNFKLLIAGKIVEKKYANKIQNLIQKNNLSHKIKLIGYIKNPFYLISNASAILSTSRWEGMPNSILQSCSLNKKVISTDCLSGPKEIKEYGFNLYLAKNNSLLDFSNKLILAMNHKTKINNKVALKKYNLNFLNKIEKILKVNV